jgi:nucleotide-binding universal stress UspA family protein
MFKRIVVAIDGSPTAQRGLKVALDLAAEQRAVVHAVHVVDDMGIVPSLDGGYIPSAFIDSYAQALRDKGYKTLDKATAQARAAGVTCKASLVETMGQGVAQTILQHARKVKGDLIVLGTHGRRGLRRVLLGSDAEAVVRDAPVPVLLVRAGTTPRRTKAVDVARGPAKRNAAASGDAPRTATPMILR